MLAERPFFIIGHPRSGTTLLRFMLASHPRLFIPEESGFIPFLVGKDKLNSRLTLNECKNILRRIGKLNILWKDKVNDISSFCSSLPEPRLSILLDQVFRNYSSDKPIIRWGDKTPLYIQYINVINEIFPDAQFIHLIRDGRDAALSAQKKWPENAVYMDLFYLLNNWVRNVESGKKAGSWLGSDRYFELRYETLVTCPMETLFDLCVFLNEKFDKSMLDHTILANEIGPGPDDHTEVLNPVTTSSVARWKTKMSPFEKKISDRIAGSLLSRLGYQLSGESDFSRTEYLNYLTLSTKFRFFDSLRKILYATGVLTLNRTMRKG